MREKKKTYLSIFLTSSTNTEYLYCFPGAPVQKRSHKKALMAPVMSPFCVILDTQMWSNDASCVLWHVL